MTDNSEEIDGCASEHMVLFNCSANSGNVMVTKDIPVILHLVCFNVPDPFSMQIVEDKITGLTVSVDSVNNGGFEMDRPEYEDFLFTSNRSSDISEESIKVYPVPSEDSLKIALPDKFLAERITIEVVDMNGRKWQQFDRQFQTQDFTISTDGMPTGEYIVVFKIENRTYTKRFVKM
jgi:hypothetical protein